VDIDEDGDGQPAQIISTTNNNQPAEDDVVDIDDSDDENVFA